MKWLTIIMVIGGLINFGFVIQNIVTSHIWLGTVMSMFSTVFAFVVAYAVRPTR